MTLTEVVPKCPWHFSRNGH